MPPRRASFLRALSARRSEPRASDGRPSGGFYSPWRAERALPQTWDMVKATEEGFLGCSWVFATISRLADAGSGIPWKVMQRQGEEWEPVDGHPYEIAIEYPGDDFSRQEMMHRAIQHLGIAGQAYLRVVRVRNEPDSFWPLWPAVTSPVPDASGWLLRYEVKIPGKAGDPERYEPSEIIHPKRPDPSDPLRGISPLRAVRQIVDMDRSMVAWNRENADNGGVPWGIFSGLSKTDPQLKRARIEIRQQLKDNKQDRFLLMGGEAKFEPMVLTPQEVNWLAARDFTLKEVCAVYGLLPSIFDPQSKYANVEQAVRFMWENGVPAMLNPIEDAFNLRLIPRQRRRDLWVHYDLSGVPALQDNIHKRLESHERNLRSGIPANKSFLLLDIPMDAQPGGDVALVASGGRLVPLEELAKPPEEKPAPPIPPAPPEPPATELAE